MCVKGKIEFLFFPLNIFFLKIRIWTIKWEFYLNKVRMNINDCLKFKKYLSLTYNFFMANISQFYGCE